MTATTIDNLPKGPEVRACFDDGDISGMSEEEIHKTLKELRTSQLELKMRNEKLRIAQEQLIESNKESGSRYQAVLKAITNYIYRVNITNGFISTIHNPACEAVTGYTAEEFSACPALWFDMIPPEDQHLVTSNIKKIFKGEKVDSIEHRIIKKDGTLRWIKNTRILFYNAEGILISYDGIIVDITDQKNAQIELQRAHDDLESSILERTAELTQVNYQLSEEIAERTQIEEALLEAKLIAENANKAKSEFVANMSHEIRTPMNAIMGMTDLALQAPLPPKIIEYLGVVKASSNILLGVINDILDFSKIESGKLSLEKIKFSLHDILTNILAMFRDRAQEKGIDFSLETGDNVPDSLMGDPLRVGQVLVNLVGNAIKFTNEGAVAVKITGQPGSDDRIQTTFDVTDTGIGISPEKIKTIFESFSQAEGSTSRNFGGSGLGLTISQKLVGLMGGEIQLSSTPGKGSTFSFSLGFEVHPPELPVPAEVYSGKRILVVDDEVMVLTMTKDLLTISGFEVETAELPSKALAMLHERQNQGNQFDLIIMDCMMPEQDGFATSKMIRNDPLLTNIPIIMQTGFFTKDFSEQRAKQAGINAILFKPVGIKLLLENIRKVLSMKTAEQRQTSGHENENQVIQLQGLSILLAEDNTFNQMLAKEVLEKAGMSVRIANNGKEALEMVDDNVDAILMDMEMPVMDGFDATRLIRQQRRFDKLPIIAMTAHAMNGYHERCLRAGMDDYISKPFKPEEIFAALLRSLVGRGNNPGRSPLFEQEIYCADSLNVDYDCVGLHLQKTYKLGPEQIETMLLSAKSSLAEELSNGEEAFAQRDLELLSRTAHSIKGVLRNLGLDTLASLAERVEKQQVRDGEQKFPALQQQFELLQNSLCSFVG